MLSQAIKEVLPEVDFETEYYGTKALRWYQKSAMNQLTEHLKNGIARILIVLPTGAGKTLTIASSLSNPEIRQALGIEGDRPLRVMFASHKHRLLSQAENTFIAGSNVEIITQSIFSDIPEDLEWDITVLDEAHHEACASFQYQLEKLGEKPIVGLTATPDRPDGYLIKFQVIINTISREQAVVEGWLAETDINSFVDDANRNKVPVTKQIIDNFGHEFGQTMMFFRTKKEVREVNDYLLEKGYNSVAVLNQSEKELDSLLDAFSEKKVQFIVNCNKISEGVDVSGCTDVYLGKSFGSYPQLNQVIGRAARPDSPCTVWELINALGGKNLDTTVVVGTPKRHRLLAKRRGEWQEREFDYVTQLNPIMSGLSSTYTVAT